MKKITRQDLLNRVNLDISFQDLALQITQEFGFGKVFSFNPMPVGYEELNCLLTTSSGRYVVKIFSKDKDQDTINSNVTALINFYSGGIPVPKLHKTIQDNYLYKLKNNPDCYLIVMDYFPGKKFTDTEPTLQDKLTITKILSQIHSLNFSTHANYDMWLTIYLPEEFANKSHFLNLSEQSILHPMVHDMSKINYSHLSKSIVHFDLHRENAMKDKHGNYCILDLASVDYNYTIFDLATFIALFCLDGKLSISENEHIYHQILGEYLRHRHLSDYELSVLPHLIKCTFASNYLIPRYLQQTSDPNPEQTNYYLSIAKSGLEICSTWGIK